MTYLLLCASAEPILGVYDGQNRLCKRIKFTQPLSEALPSEYAKLQREFAPSRLIYTHTPGSFMALKIAYCFFATAAIAQRAQLFGVSAFAFAPLIRANRRAAFVPNPVRLVSTKELQNTHPHYFDAAGELVAPPLLLPDELDEILPQLVLDARPIYCLDAY